MPLPHTLPPLDQRENLINLQWYQYSKLAPSTRREERETRQDPPQRHDADSLNFAQRFRESCIFAQPFAQIIVAAFVSLSVTQGAHDQNLNWLSVAHFCSGRLCGFGCQGSSVPDQRICSLGNLVASFFPSKRRSWLDCQIIAL